jgi:hypothetical protein
MNRARHAASVAIDGGKLKVVNNRDKNCRAPVRLNRPP